MQPLTVQSYAKLNLGLWIVSRRSDGFHNILTLFHRISLHDTLRLTKKSRGFSLQCSSPKLSAGEDNIITRAYRLLQKKFPNLGGVSVGLTKRIPIGGGLGGGSSNAAAFLLGMKRLYGLKISQSGLATLGGKLGADVPFFLYDVNQAVGKGRGDRIIPKPSKGRLWFVLLLANKGVSTKKVYQSLLGRLRPASLTKATLAVTILCDFLDRSKIPLAARMLVNELEPPAFRLRPSIGKTIARLGRLGVDGARMSGSGPTVFALLSHEQEAKGLARKLRQLEFTGKVIICSSF